MLGALVATFGAEQIGLTRLPTRSFCSCLCRGQSHVNVFCRASFPAVKQAEVLGMNSAGRSYVPQMKTLGVLHHMHGAPLPHNSPVR